MQDNINAVLSPSEYSDKIQDEKEIKRWRKTSKSYAKFCIIFAINWLGSIQYVTLQGLNWWERCTIGSRSHTINL